MADFNSHTTQTNGIQMHYVEAGEGPLVVLCHGFPESWYSWRHQIRFLSENGFRVVAPDQRGYGQTDAPEDIDQYNILQLVGDIVGLLKALKEDSAVIVGHDWGSPVAWTCAQLRPDLFRAVASCSVPMGIRGSRSPIEAMSQLFGDRFFYQLYFQTPGVAEHELQHDTAETMRKMLYSASGAINRVSMTTQVPNPPHKSSYMLERMPDPGEDLPDWLTQEDIDFYAGEFQRTGFRGGLNWYRNIHRNWELTGAFQDLQIQQPALFITGDRDVVPYSEEALAAMKVAVPNLTNAVVLPGIGHWTQQEAADDVNRELLTFLQSL